LAGEAAWDQLTAMVRSGVEQLIGRASSIEVGIRHSAFRSRTRPNCKGEPDEHIPYEVAIAHRDQLLLDAARRRRGKQLSASPKASSSPAARHDPVKLWLLRLPWLRRFIRPAQETRQDVSAHSPQDVAPGVVR
jgi:hypothetical protein